MSHQGIKPEAGRRPVYPVDADGEKGAQQGQKDLQDGSEAEDPSSDENTDSANHTNDDEDLGR